MKTLLTSLGATLVILILAVACFLIAMRFHDGPMEIVSGGPFKTGEPVSSPTSWDFIKGRPTIEFQTMDPPTSRTVWLGVHEGRLFIVSGYMTTTIGKVWKHWPYYIQDDNRVLLRIDGKIYHQRLERIIDGPLVEPVMGLFSEKYGGSATPTLVAANDFWLYEVLSR
jgi:hypothetical protein